MKQVLILGSTGSVGVNTLDVLARNPGHFGLWGITANVNSKLLVEQIRRYQPRYAALNDEKAALEVRKLVEAEGIRTSVLSGPMSLQELAEHDEVDIVMAAIVGAAGLLPTLKAVEASKRVLLANKEALVCAGPLFMQAVSRSNALLMPVDSEHNAIFQCLPDGKYDASQIERILLTGSGGPFRDKSLQELLEVTPEQACAHPNWDMGRKISVDSATMMNKGLELIEACWLFDVASDQIQIVLHRQSVIHSMIQYRDGSVIAQMGNPDMRTPIAQALGWPERLSAGVDALDFARLKLDFEEVDFSLYPCLSLAIEAAKVMGSMPIVLNAANEIAVNAFLVGRIGFLQIAEIVELTLNSANFPEPVSIEEVLAVDLEARSIAQSLIDTNRHVRVSEKH
ncbi:MAG: 1-deoxy-D-xylulose-5-phosphate reductoisomerase [Porticoccaceae bacterium]